MVGHTASILGDRRKAVPAGHRGPRLVHLVIGALALFGAPLLESGCALAQEGGPGPMIQRPGPILRPGPVGPRDEPGLPSRAGPSGSTVSLAFGCHYAKCLPSDRSCVQLHGRATYRVCPPLVRR